MICESEIRTVRFPSGETAQVVCCLKCDAVLGRPEDSITECPVCQPNHPEAKP